jgi:choline dehydrogenase-like flavoprotein
MRPGVRTPYDAIVIGSGITGGWAAKELTEHGLKTLVLEAGRDIDPARDYVEHVQPWQMHFRGWGDRNKLEREQPIQRSCYACDELGSKFFVNDLENPYTFDDGKRFEWLRGRQVGGRSIMWGRQVYRWSDLDFGANARDGVAVDWPIRYKDIAPWYSYVERFIGVSGNHENLAQLPDGEFLPPMALNCVEEQTRERMERAFGRQRVLTIGRCAILTQNHNGRAACHYCGPCERGCITASYFSSIGSTLPAARKTGNLTLRPNSVVEQLLYDPATNRISGVRVIDAESLEVLEFQARIVFLCASTLESARLLLHSTSAAFPDGLANSSGQVGRNLMDHCMGGGARGDVDGFLDRKTSGNRPNGIYIPRFRNATEPTSKYLRGFAFQGGGGRSGWGRGSSAPGFGADFKRSLFEPGPWGISFYGFGECLPQENNYMTLDPVVKDKWGVPAVHVNMTWGPNELALLEDMQVTAAEMLDAAGVRNITTFNEHAPPGRTIHEMGTARMGKDSKTSVLNQWNQAWDVPNLFITDGSCMASTGCQNPSITYMALTARAVDHVVELLNRHEL